MKKKYIFEKITDAYLNNIADITEQYTKLLHLLYRENDFSDEEVEWLFGELEEKAGRYAAYLHDKENVMFHEDEIYSLAKKVKKEYDSYR